MVHRPFVAPATEPKKVPEKLQQIETDVAQCKSTLEEQDRRYQEQAKVIVSLEGTVALLRGCVKDLMVKLGGEVPDFLIDSGPIPTSLVTAPTTTETTTS